MAQITIDDTIDDELGRINEFPKYIWKNEWGQEREVLINLAKQDLEAYECRDPASHGQHEKIQTSYPSYLAVMRYRIGSFLLQSNYFKDRYSCARIQIAVQNLSAKSRIEAGIEIHPAAIIGKRFVIDHGWGTVIGETTIIGDDCYILGCVTLGATGIANNPNGKRHPTLGNRVQIGAHVRVFGNVTIGDDVFISPYAIITKDVPKNMRVSLVNQLQHNNGSVNRSGNVLKLLGVVRVGDEIYIQCNELKEPTAHITSNQGTELVELTVRPHTEDSKVLMAKLDLAIVAMLCDKYGVVNLRISDGESQVEVQNIKPLINDTCLRAEHAR